MATFHNNSLSVDIVVVNPADINECANKETYDCPRTTTCKNTNGSYECECEHGDCRGMWCVSIVLDVPSCVFV